MISVMLNTLVQVAFLIVLAGAPADASNLWTAWANAAAFAVCCALLLCLRVEYRRLAVDRGAALHETGCYLDRAVGCF